MRTIMVMNAKGGSGKTTISTNLASYYADQGKQVVLADFDPQESSLSWLAERPAGRPPIKGIAAHTEALRPARQTDIMLMDVPASVHGRQLNGLLKRAQTVIVPVLPSPIDMRAAARFIKELRADPAVSSKKVKIGLVANRARGNTNIFLQLDEFLGQHKGIPYLTAFRESTNYIKAAERGLGIFEFAPSATALDREEWQPLLKWLKSKRSH